MPIDFDALVLNPNYAIMGVSATYTPSGGDATAITVIDFTRGEAVLQQGGDGVSVLVPTVHAKVGDVAEPVQGGQIVIGGNTWRILGKLPIPGPGGIASGEVALHLELIS